MHRNIAISLKNAVQILKRDRVKPNIYVILLGILLVMSLEHASINVTYINTTVILSQNTTGKVVEVLNLYLSNNVSVSQYTQDRAAINLTLSEWQKALNTNLLVEHILNPKSSVHGFEFLPGPVTAVGNTGIAQITMSYFVSNITTVNEIAPRKFEYAFNNSVFNFIHTASGESLPQAGRLNIIIPVGSQLLSLYPLPDYPQINVLGNYANATQFSWYSGEPLSKFTFTYIITQTLGGEVLSYFHDLSTVYKPEFYAFIFIVILIIAAYFLVNSKPRV